MSADPTPLAQRLHDVAFSIIGESLVSPPSQKARLEELAVEIRQVADHLTQRLAEAASRVEHFLDARAAMPHLDPEVIYAVGNRVSNHESVSLTVTDLKVLVEAALADSTERGEADG